MSRSDKVRHWNLFRKKDSVTIQYTNKFLWKIAELLDEGYSFYDAIYLLVPHHFTMYEQVLRRVDESFREGRPISTILEQLLIPKSSLLSITIAEKDGRIANALRAVSKKIERQEETTKKLRNLLAYPLFLFIFITSLLLIFRQHFLPNIQLLANSRTSETAFSALPHIVAKLPDFFIGGGVLIVIAVVVVSLYYKKATPEKKIDFMLAIPVVSQLFEMRKTILFGQELSNLLEAGFSMQEALAVLSEQTVDVVVGEIAHRVNNQVVFGEPFHMAVQLTKGITKELSAFAKHGEYNGHLAKELLLYSEHLDDRLTTVMQRLLSMLQPLLFSIIALCILAAYLAILLPVYNLLDTI